MRLFCFPYAGGSANIYNAWGRFIDPSVELVPFELSGRGRRLDEPHYDTMEEAVDDVLSSIYNSLPDQDYAFYGHSMGATIAYELALKIKGMSIRQPSHVFVSGRGAPDIKDEKDRRYHLLPEAEFREKIQDLGGTPPDFFDYPELVELFLPLLRSDFKIASETYLDRKVEPLDYGLTVFLGKDEELTAEQAYGWRKHTNKRCTIHCFDGEHFFLNDHVPEIVEVINGQLAGG